MVPASPWLTGRYETGIGNYSYSEVVDTARFTRSVIDTIQPARENEAGRLAMLCLGDNIP